MKNRKHEKLAFISHITQRQSISNISMLTNSLRSFGGELRECPIWVMIPEIFNELSSSDIDQFNKSKVKVHNYDIDPDLIEFPFAFKVFAAAKAEEILINSTELLVWFDDDCIILQEPDEFVLPSTKLFGFRPVHHKLIGTNWGQKIDNFWEYLFKVFEVSLESTFPMITHMGEEIYPYFNAGTYAVRPEMNLLNKWKNEFVHHHRDKFFLDVFQENYIYKLFFHQVIFTSIMLNSLEQHEMQELSPRINYPLHLHSEIPQNLQPIRINELITVRYEDVFKSNWEVDLPIHEPILSWLRSQLSS